MFFICLGKKITKLVLRRRAIWLPLIFVSWLLWKNLAVQSLLSNLSKLRTCFKYSCRERLCKERKYYSTLPFTMTMFPCISEPDADSIVPACLTSVFSCPCLSNLRVNDANQPYVTRTLDKRTTGGTSQLPRGTILTTINAAAGDNGEPDGHQKLVGGIDSLFLPFFLF